MYSLPYFTEKDADKVIAFMKENSFAIITGFGEQYPSATQIPMEVVVDNDGKIILSGHLMKNTDHHRAFVKNDNVLVIFHGPHCYVSASWYVKKDVASTWNYISVHAKGILKFLDEAALLNMLQRLTAFFENDAHSPALVEKMPEEYVSKMMKAIIAFEIEVTHLDNVFKLSQNRDKETFSVVTDKLKAQGGQAADIADEMQQRGDQLFNK